MKIAIGSDHCGVALKAALFQSLSGVAEVLDKGAFDVASCDYCDYAVAVAKDVSAGAADFGILVCKTGIGMSMAVLQTRMPKSAAPADTSFATATA